METHLNTLYRIEELIQTALVSKDGYELEEALRLLSEVITDTELSYINSEEEDENHIPLIEE